MALFDRLAEIAGEYLKKGRPVYIEGRLKTRKWTDKEGKDNYTTEVIAESMQLLGGREGGEGGGGVGGGRSQGADFDRPAGDGGSGGERAARPAQRPAPQKPAAAKQATGFDDMDDDIPF